MRSIVLAGVFLLLVNCNLHSELNIPQVGSDNSQKAKCSFKPTNNCWTRSLNLLMDCVGPIHPEDHQILYPDKKLCTNNSGQHIIFKNPGVLETGNTDESLQFSYYGPDKKCFDFRGTAESFVIESGDYGSLSVLTLPDGEIEVQCFFDESFNIPKEAITLGCQGSSLEGDTIVPKALLSGFQDGDAGGYQFQFFGFAGGYQQLFQCYNPQ